VQLSQVFYHIAPLEVILGIGALSSRACFTLFWSSLSEEDVIYTKRTSWPVGWVFWFFFCIPSSWPAYVLRGSNGTCLRSSNRLCQVFSVSRRVLFLVHHFDGCSPVFFGDTKLILLLLIPNAVVRPSYLHFSWAVWKRFQFFSAIQIAKRSCELAKVCTSLFFPDSLCFSFCLWPSLCYRYVAAVLFLSFSPLIPDYCASLRPPLLTHLLILPRSLDTRT